MPAVRDRRHRAPTRRTSDDALPRSATAGRRRRRHRPSPTPSPRARSRCATCTRGGSRSSRRSDGGRRSRARPGRRARPVRDASRKLRRASALIASGTGASSGAMSYHLRTVSSSARLGSGQAIFSTWRYSCDTPTARSSALMIASSSPREVHDPVRLPRLCRRRPRTPAPSAASASSTPDQVKRTRIGRPSNVSVALEDARVSGERSDHRRVEQPGPSAVRPVDRPPLRVRVVEAERHADEAAAVVGAEHVLVPEPAGKRPRRDLRLELVPLVGSGRGAAQGAGCARSTSPSRSRSPGRRSFLHCRCHVAPPVVVGVSTLSSK